MGYDVLISKNRYIKLRDFWDINNRRSVIMGLVDTVLLDPEFTGQEWNKCDKIFFECNEEHPSPAYWGLWLHPVMVKHLTDYMPESIGERMLILLKALLEPQFENLFNALDISGVRNTDFRRTFGNTLTISFL